MKKLLSCVAFSALALCLTPHTLYAMDSSEIEYASTAQRMKNIQAVTDYLESDINPKIALYGEGDAHTRESDYTPFLTIDKDLRNCPKVRVDITNLDDMAVIPPEQLDCVELRHIQSTVFSKNPEATFGDIARVLKKGGTLKFNDMWGGKKALSLKLLFLKNNAGLKKSDPESYTQYEEMSPMELVKVLRARGQLSPFDQFLEESEYEECRSRKLRETSFWGNYIEQLSTFFEEVGFTDLTYSTEGYNFWMVRKK